MSIRKRQNNKRRRVLMLALLVAHAIAASAFAQNTTRAPDTLQRDARRVRATLREAQALAPGIPPTSTVEGTLLDLDSVAVTIRLPDGFALRLSRELVDKLAVYRGTSRLRGLLIGYGASLPIAYAACAGKKYECSEGGVIGLAGAVLGVLLGGERWDDLPFP